MKTTYFVASSVDGFIATTDGRVDWLTFVGSDDEANGYTEFFDSVDGLVMGRTTYDQVQTFGDWPYGEKPCWVLTRSNLETTPPHIQSETRPDTILKAAEQQGLSHLWIVGGGKTAAHFLQAACLDKMVVSILPTVLSAGVPVLPGLQEQKILKLDSHKVRSNGITELVYLF